MSKSISPFIDALLHPYYFLGIGFPGVTIAFIAVIIIIGVYKAGKYYRVWDDTRRKLQQLLDELEVVVQQSEDGSLTTEFPGGLKTKI